MGGPLRLREWKVPVVRGVMRLLQALFLLLWAWLESSMPRSRRGSFRHSLSYSYLEVSESSQRVPQFSSMALLDDEPIARYDIPTRKMVPLVPWMEVEEAKTFVVPEMVFRADLEGLSKLNPQTGGLHTWQAIWGCELREDGSKGGFLHYGYNGEDFISFDKKTLRWVTAQPQAQKVKEKWEEDPARSERIKFFLENNCLEWLQKCLSYQMEAVNKTATMWWITVGIVAAVTVGLWILYRSCNWLGCRKIVHRDETNCFNHRSLEYSPLIYCTEDEIQPHAMLQSKITSEDCCGQKTELRKGERRPLMASSDAYSDNKEGPALEISELGLEERLEDADAPKPGMEGLQDEVSPGTSEEQADEHLAGEERGETQLQLEGSQTQPEAQDGEGFCCS